MILAATAGQTGSVTVPLAVLIAVLTSGFAGMSGFLAWLVKQVTLQSRFQAETSVVLKAIADRATEDRAKIEKLEERVRNHNTRQQHVNDL